MGGGKRRRKKDKINSQEVKRKKMKVEALKE